MRYGISVQVCNFAYVVIGSAADVLESELDNEEDNEELLLVLPITVSAIDRTNFDLQEAV